MEGNGKRLLCPVCEDQELEHTVMTKGLDIYVCRMCGTTVSVPHSVDGEGQS